MLSDWFVRIVLGGATRSQCFWNVKRVLDIAGDAQQDCWAACRSDCESCISFDEEVFAHHTTSESLCLHHMHRTFFLVSLLTTTHPVTFRLHH